MSLPERHWLYHVPPAWSGVSPYFITLCCQLRGPDQLCLPSTSEKLLTAVRHYHDAHRWHVSLWLLIPDHLHALVSCPLDEDLTKLVAAWKRFTSRDAGIDWQKGFFDHRLRADESFEEKANYIRQNPVRKNLAATPEAWPHQWSPSR